MSSILIKNPLAVATMNDSQEEFSGGHVFIENGVIKSLGPDTPNIQADKTIDAIGMVIMPGFINTHHHLYQTLTRNIPLMQDQPLFSWLTNHYEVWRELTTEAIEVSTQTGLLELMKSGVTTSSDHLYLFPSKASPELIDTEIEAAKVLGIRFQPTRGSMSLGKSRGGLPPDDVVQTEDVIQKDTERLLAKYHEDSDGAMIRIALAPCSPFSVTTELMKQTAAFARTNGLQLHTHLAETLDEEAFCLESFGLRPVGLMQELNWLTSNAWYAHSVHLNDDEIRVMGENQVGISHCPSSNMRLGSGIARIRELLDANVNVSLGVDGSASNDSGDMLLEMRNAMLISRLREQDYWLSARDVLSMVTRGGAAALGRHDIGQLSVGKQADLALFEMNNLAQAGSLSDPISSLIFTTRQRPVDYLIVQGKIIMEKGDSKVDESDLVSRHNKIAADMLLQAAQRTKIDFSTHQ
ncbi:MAG: 8-oxoguanine deaminase [FCB group bacterium]|nr:8-oxoguanine deaminase [FCB group bacterium]MBL7027169.1 8-oxoguanine deaminase [Candidatus Neomarinimicrobiota bacterium]MBL7120596.1 8-oxoguanine deaminase [Candidatus Neomarinimicrobiota bacterium]